MQKSLKVIAGHSLTAKLRFLKPSKLKLEPGICGISFLLTGKVVMALVQSSTLTLPKRPVDLFWLQKSSIAQRLILATWKYWRGTAPRSKKKSG